MLMIIMKFGGTSVQDAPSVERVVNLIRARVHLRPVVVISAMGKTTKKLLRSAELAAAGDASAGLAQLDELRTYHTDIIDGLQAAEAQAPVDESFGEIENLLNGLSILRELTLRGRDRVAAYGEFLSSVIVAEALKRGGVDAVWLEARQFMITDESYTRARPLFEIANAKIAERIHPCLQAGQVPVTQGYIGSTTHGVTTTLGFEGSDYTAAIMGAALDAEDIQIWTDVNGIMTADPALLPEARTVKVISFAEAKELTHFGAKVLHPKTLFPAHEKAIPVHIYNSKQPTAPGTVITTAAPPTRTPVKSIAYKKPLSLVTITSNDSLSRLRFFKMIFEAVERTQLFTYLAALSESSVVLAVDPSEAIAGLMDELHPEAQVTLMPDQAIVCLVGEQLNQLPGFAAEVFRALKDMRFSLISHGASEHSLVLIVQAAEVENALRQLHEVLFQNPDPEIFC
jgi:aspartate kinase